MRKFETLECTVCRQTKSVDNFYTFFQASKNKSYRNKQCKSCMNKKSSAYNSSRVGKSNRLRRAFGIDIAQYESMLDSQNGVCAICGEEESGLHVHSKQPKSLAVDHCHDTGKVRGLLCGNCNYGLGMFKDNPDLLNKAIQYILKHKGDNT